jgi:hypothetical protein
MEKKTIMLAVYILAAILILNIYPAKAQVSPQDSMVLVEFYNTTNGPNWVNNSNWLVTRVPLWYGIFLDPSSYYVLIIQLPNNNLSGYISPLATQLSHLAALILSGNNITGQLPDWLGNCQNLNNIVLEDNLLTGSIPTSYGNGNNNHLVELNLTGNLLSGNFPDSVVQNQHLRYVRISNNSFNSFPLRDSIINQQHPLSDLQLNHNCLTFKDIVPYMQSNHPPNWSFHYAPQDSILESIDTTVLLGSTLVLDSWVDTCSGNTYQWFKNGNLLNIIPVANSQKVLSNIQYSDSGTYTCDVRNPEAWLLFLHRRLIKVHVTNTIGMQEPAKPQEIRITQNAAENMLNIFLDFGQETSVRCRLYDLNGRLVMRLYEGQTRQQEFHYRLERLKKGVYVVQTTAGEITTNQKIIVY